MSLATYADLKATVIRFSGRDDLSDLLDDFIVLTEEQIYSNEMMPLRLRGLETTATAATISGTNTVALPTGYLQIRSITLNSGGVERELIFNSPSAIPKKSGSGIPVYFTIIGSNIVFDITPDGVYTLENSYYGKPTALSSSNQTNFVLTNHPTIYVNGCLSELKSFAGEIQDSEAYFGKFIRSIKGAIRNDRTGRYVNAQGRVQGSTP